MEVHSSSEALAADAVAYATSGERQIGARWCDEGPSRRNDTLQADRIRMRLEADGDDEWFVTASLDSEGNAIPATAQREVNRGEPGGEGETVDEAGGEWIELLVAAAAGRRGRGGR